VRKKEQKMVTRW